MGRERARGIKGTARVVILTIIVEEFLEARTAFEAHENIPGTNYFSSVSAGHEWDVVVTRCMDRGNLCSGNEVRNIIDDLRPIYVIVVGIAGGLCDPPRSVSSSDSLPEGHQQAGRDGVKLGDVVVADHLEYAEFLKVVDNQTISHRQFSMDQPSFWIRRAFLAAMEHTLDLLSVLGQPPTDPSSVLGQPQEPATPRLRFGQIVSAEKIFSAEANPVQDILLHPFVKAIAVDMESVGVGWAIHEARNPYWYNPHYVVIRGISDLVGKSGNEATRDAWKRFAARAAAQVARALVNELPPLDGPEDDESWWQRLRRTLFPYKARTT
jgi:nucleoside phosphorylase